MFYFDHRTHFKPSDNGFYKFDTISNDYYF
jgi:hypothetical protein